MSDMVQCSGCIEMAQGVPERALPGNWDLLSIEGDGHYFCPACIACGAKEMMRAAAGLPRTVRASNEVQAFYRPAHRELLLIMGEDHMLMGMDAAIALAEQIHGALMTRETAIGMAGSAAA